MAVQGHGIKYRPDIDGLRAIAVVPVVLFHLGLKQFGGGFVGVDVFFVISGFLISAGIQSDIAARKFSLFDFYDRRCRRILPALFLVVLLSLVAGWFLFLPDDFKDVGSSAVAVSVFSSNLLFWQQADYFSGPVDLKPLVHTWSLAVEEQYYILLPIFLWCVMRFAKARFIAWTLGLALLSFAVSVAMVRWEPSGAYYLIPSRAWELLLGALLAQGAAPPIRSRAVGEAVAAIGLVLIIGAVFLLSPNSPFPGVNALYPVVGSAMVIYAGGYFPDTMVARLLAFRPILFTGLISYSVYLWHWPLIVFARYHLLSIELEPSVMLAVGAATYIAGVLSWRFVERPFRSRERVGRRAIFLFAAAGIALFSVVGIAIFASEGVPQRFAGLKVPVIARADKPVAGEPVCMTMKGFDMWGADKCFLSRKPGPVTLIWGDSHAYQYRRAIHDVIGPQVPGSILLYASAGCPPVLDVTVPDRPFCRANNDQALKLIRAYKARRVILISHWEYGLDKSGAGIDVLRKTIDRLKAMGVEVGLVGDNPEYDFNNMPLLYQRIGQITGGKRQDFKLTPKLDASWNAEARAFVGPGEFFDPRAVLCPGGGNQCLVYTEGQPLMSESNHLSYYGAELVVRNMAPLFGAAKQARKGE